LAAGYCLSGAMVNHVCCRHLYGDDRLLTVWPDEGHVTVVALGHHDGSALDVYDALLNALGLEIPDAERDKPSCCGRMTFHRWTLSSRPRSPTPWSAMSVAGGADEHPLIPRNLTLALEDCPEGPLWNRGEVSPKRNDHYTGRMTRNMTATEVKTHILGLLDEVAAGEQIEITKHGRIVARLIPAHGPHSLRGRFTGVAMTFGADEDVFSTGAAWNLP
jgi:prevent-host-death family protein